MELEKQVCSLELANRLKKLGVKQESAFCWGKYLVGKENPWVLFEWLDVEPEARKYCYAAFTVAELGEILRLKLGNEHDYQSRPMVDEENKAQFKWQAWNSEEGLYDKKGYYILADTEADARAQMLVYLIEQGIIQPKEVMGR